MLKKILNRPKFLTRNILVLSAVSFFTDVASEMLFPVIPLYLKEIGYSFLVIGILEGTAELVAGGMKLYSGRISDRIRKRGLFIQIGYAISAIAKPLIGFLTSFWGIFFLRFADRVGKGIRVAPRDALLADESNEATRGRVFGFHRGLDTLGATLGPIISFIFLFFYMEYSTLFLSAFIPGVIAVVLTFIIKERKYAQAFVAPESISTGISKTQAPQSSIKEFINFFKTSSHHYKKMIFGFFGMALINGSNVFLLLRARELGLPNVYILGAYVLYNFVYAASSYPAGVLADKYGFKKIYVFGIFIFALVYGLFGLKSLSVPILFVLFAVYGIFSAIDDGTTKAWLTLHIDREHVATGLGLQMLTASLGFFIASIATGLLWQYMGGSIAFSLLSILSLVALCYFLFLPNEKPNSKMVWERTQKYGK